MDGINFSYISLRNIFSILPININLYAFGSFWVPDIETYNVETQLNKVTVTGNITTEEVIRVLQKIGKSASTWEGDEISCWLILYIFVMPWILLP